MKRFLILVILLLNIISIAHANERGLFWKLKAPNGSTHYLFGTIHTDDNRIIKFLPVVKKSINASDLLVVEIKPDNHSQNLLMKDHSLKSDLTDDELKQIKKHFINQVDSREKDLTVLNTPRIQNPEPVAVFENFITLDTEELNVFIKENRLSIDIDDIICIQEYFKKEQRNPTVTEIKALDTYWSDHCRHTTFLTRLNSIEFEGDYKTELENSFQQYLQIKKEIGKENTPITLMELGTILPKYFISKNLLPEFHHSKENNAATIEIDVDLKDKKEKWLLLFKNETHNHPTEIEPFGGAATCIGGAIRDPLSGRAFVYQAMRLSGAGNPLENINATIPFKLSQQKISKEAALGYSSYGNQIGLSTSHVAEIFHEGYKAKPQRHYSRRHTDRKVMVHTGFGSHEF